jgi:1,5-anhydro-D-fructose reductase (1,5-anhydro-D-mannitol-forming)
MEGRPNQAQNPTTGFVVLRVRGDGEMVGTSNDVRWGMIGCGSVAETKSAPSYQQAAGSTLIAVSSRRPEAARAYALRHGVELVFDNAAELICSPAVDAVYIATPPASHLHYALQVARAGKPCCVEKPVAMSHEEALAMVAAFERAGQPLFVAYYRRSLPRFNMVRDWLRDDAIGSVRHVNWTLARTPTPRDIAGQGGWRTQSESAPRGYFDDLACHGLDLLDYLIGPIGDAAGFHTNQSGLYEVPDAFVASWLHECGATGAATWSFASPFRHDHMIITGAKGEIELSVFNDGEIRLKTDLLTQIEVVENPSPIQLCHVEKMNACLRGGIAHPSTGQSAARTARVMDAISADKKGRM